MTPLIIGAHGYIGSRLMADIPGAVAAEGRYQNLSRDYLAGFGAIVFLAGHTTVRACEDDPRGAEENNIAGFRDICARLQPAQRLIFASTGAVYHGLGDATELDDGLPLYRYDEHKRAQERIASANVPQWYALRLGTVCGVSPKPDDRPLLNRLVADAMDKGRLTVANPHAMRAIVSLADVVAAVRVFLGETAPEPGAYNVASFNATVGQCARFVAQRLGVGITLAPDAPTYSFGMQTRKLEATGWAPGNAPDGLFHVERSGIAFAIINSLRAAREAREAA